MRFWGKKMDAVFLISHSFSLSQCQAGREEGCQFVLSHASQGASFFMSPWLSCAITAFMVLISEHLLLRHVNTAFLSLLLWRLCCPITASVSTEMIIYSQPFTKDGICTFWKHLWTPAPRYLTACWRSPSLTFGNNGIIFGLQNSPFPTGFFHPFFWLCLWACLKLLQRKKVSTRWEMQR